MLNIVESNQVIENKHFYAIEPFITESYAHLKQFINNSYTDGTSNKLMLIAAGLAIGATAFLVWHYRSPLTKVPSSIANYLTVTIDTIKHKLARAPTGKATAEPVKQVPASNLPIEKKEDKAEVIHPAAVSDDNTLRQRAAAQQQSIPASINLGQSLLNSWVPIDTSDSM